MSAKISVRLLALGVAAGVMMVAYGLTRGWQSKVSSPKAPALSADVVATINGVPITSSRFAILLSAVGATTEGHQMLDPRERSFLLDQVIADELLLQRSVGLGLAEDDPIAHRRLVEVLTESITTEASEVRPDSETLRRFYADHPQLFAREPRLELTHIFVRDSGGGNAGALRRAQIAAQKLRAHEPADRVKEEEADELPMALPSGLIPAETVRDYLGLTAYRTAQELKPGAVSDPVRVSGGYEVLRVESKEPGGIAPFESVRDSVLQEYRRSTADAALKQYVDKLRADAAIQINDSAVRNTKPSGANDVEAE
jgi:peptidyl-prolyl cis-trans isomerase C